MIYIEDFQDILKIIRRYIHELTGVNLKDIRDATDTYGSALLKLLEGKKYNSYKLNDSVVLMDLETRNNESDVSMVEGTDIILYKSYELKLITYGNSAMQIGNMIYSKFNTDDILTRLLEEGIYIESISYPTLFNEFVNDVIWPRTDVSLLISIKHKFKHNTGYEFDVLNSVKTIDI